MTVDLGKVPDLQECIETAWVDGVKEFKLVNTYRSNTSTYALLHIKKHMSGITIRGSGILDGGGLASHIIVVEDADATIKGIKISSGNTTDPVRVAKDYRGRPLRSIFEAIDGAGILVLGKSNVNLDDCRVTDNHSGMCGGSLSNQGTGLVEVSECVFEDNSAYHTGGAIDNLTHGATIIVKGSEFKNNLSNAGSICGGPHGQITVFKKTKASLYDNSFSGTTYAIDAAIGSTIDDSGNTYNDKPIKPRRPGQGGNLVDKSKHAKQLLFFNVHLVRHGLLPFIR